MPSMLHEVLASFFRERPSLAPELLSRALGAPMAAHAHARISAAEFRDLMPADYRADAFLCLEDAAGTVLESLIVEVQLSADEDKRYSWPLYIAGARARFRAKATLVVVAVDAEVARWCAGPIELDRAGNVIRPLVVGPSLIPVITDPETARADLVMALLSVAAHGREPGAADIGVAAMTAVHELGAAGVIDVNTSVMYADFIQVSLNEAARIAVENMMRLEDYEFQSETFRKRIEMRERASFDKGLQDGERAGRREMLSRQLTRRFGELPAEVQARVEAADIAELDLWAERVLTAPSLADVFATA